MSSNLFKGAFARNSSSPHNGGMDYPALLRAMLNSGRYRNQLELAKRLGVTQPTISRWLKGGIAPHLPQHLAIVAEARQIGLLFDDTLSGGAGPGSPSYVPPMDSSSKKRLPLPNAVKGHSVALDHRVPAYGQAMGGTDGEFVLNGNEITQVPAPPSLRGVPEAYAVFVAGESMEPRYFAGEVVFVNPRLPVRRGDFVVAQIAGKEGDPPLGYVKRFVSMNEAVLRLEQFQPPKRLEFPRIQVVSVHRIVMAGEG